MGRLSEELPEKYAKDINKDEKVLKAICGYTKKEWLVCTDKGVYVLKYGFLTGHSFGAGIWHADYSQISSVNLDWHIMGSSNLSVLTSSSTPINGASGFFARSDEEQASPNTIACYNSQDAKPRYQAMIDYINERVAEAHRGKAASAPQNGDLAGELAKLADLHRQGVLDDDEFASAKARLLKG